MCAVQCPPLQVAQLIADAMDFQGEVQARHGTHCKAHKMMLPTAVALRTAAAVWIDRLGQGMLKG